jgi:hypothetical protein
VTQGIVDTWLTASDIGGGPVFRSINRAGRIAPHDLRGTGARLRHEAGAELEQIGFLLGQSAVGDGQHGII